MNSCISKNIGKQIMKQRLKLMILWTTVCVLLLFLTSCGMLSDSNKEHQDRAHYIATKNIQNGLNKCRKYLTQSGVYQASYSGQYAYNTDTNIIIYFVIYSVTYQGTPVFGDTTQYFMYSVADDVLDVMSEEFFTYYYDGINNGIMNGYTGFF